MRGLDRRRWPAVSAERLIFAGTAATLIVIAVLARGVFLDARQLFRDEAASWLESSYPLDMLLHHAASEPYPPLYALLLHGWMRLFGDSEAALRSLSVLAGLGVVAVAWRWAHEALGRVGGLVALVIVALSPLLLSNARDARMYALETAAAGVGWYLVWRTLSGRVTTRRSRVAHGLGAGAAVAVELWTMAYGIPIAGLQGLALLGGLAGPAIARRAARPRSSGHEDGRTGILRAGVWTLAGLLAGGATFLLWLPRTLAVATNGEAYWTPRPELEQLTTTYRTMIVGWPLDLAAWKPIADGVLALALVGLVFLIAGRGWDRRMLALCLGAGLALVPVTWIASQLRPVYDTRYFGAAVAPLAISVAAGVVGCGAAVRRIAHPGGRVAGRAALLVESAAAVVLLATMARAAALWFDDWREDRYVAPARQVALALAADVRPGDVLITPDARSYFPLAYLLGRSEPFVSLDVPLYSWDSGNEPFYRAQTLLRPEFVVSRPELGEQGWRALPGLAANGRIWLVVLANGRNREIHFAPLEQGELVERQTELIASSTEVAQIRELAVR